MAARGGVFSLVVTAVFGGVFSGCDGGEGIEKPTDRMQTPSIENRRSRRLNSRPGNALKPKLNGFLSESSGSALCFRSAKAQQGALLENMYLTNKNHVSNRG